MGLYERVNERYAKTFYYKEFDQQWKTFGGIETLGLVGSTMVCHDKTLKAVNSKRDVFLDGPTAFGYLIDSIGRNKIPLSPNDIMIPAMVHSARRRIPTDGTRYRDALEEMIASGQIPKSYLENFPPHK